MYYIYIIYIYIIIKYINILLFDRLRNIEYTHEELL